MKKRRHVDVIIDEVARPGELPMLIIKGVGMPHDIACMPRYSASLTQDAGTLFVACRATCPGFVTLTLNAQQTYFIPLKSCLIVNRRLHTFGFNRQLTIKQTLPNHLIDMHIPRCLIVNLATKQNRLLVYWRLNNFV